MTSPIILAVDTPDIELAKRWISATRESIDVFKLGLEFYLNHGFGGISAIQRETGRRSFSTLSFTIFHILFLRRQPLLAH